MYQGASRAKCNAVGPRLERGVRPQLAAIVLTRRSDMNSGGTEEAWDGATQERTQELWKCGCEKNPQAQECEYEEQKVRPLLPPG
jgi:hypothetical protein